MAKIQFKSCALHNFIFFPLHPVSLKRSKQGPRVDANFSPSWHFKSCLRSKVKRQQEIAENREKCAGRQREEEQGTRKARRGGGKRNIQLASYFVTNVFVRQLQPGIKEDVAAHISSSIMPLCHDSNCNSAKREGRGGEEECHDWMVYTGRVLNTYLWQLNSLWSCAWDSSGSRRDSDTRPCHPPLLTWWSACRHVPPRERTSAPDTFHPTSACPVQSSSRVYRRWKEENCESAMRKRMSATKGRSCLCFCLCKCRHPVRLFCATFKAAHLVVNFYQTV